MEQKEPSKVEDMKSQDLGTKKLKTSSKSKRQIDKPLPWWVELLFVQIGLPDKLLIKILKSKKEFADLFKNDKKLIFTFLLFFGVLGYFYPVVKYAKAKLNCESSAKTYIIQKKSFKNMNIKQLRMLSTNFCNGGDEIYEIQNMN